MIIGEAPGTEEDRQGKPFVGRSGQLLDQILNAADFDPEEDVFITNAVFRLPPGDGGKPLRKPTNDEIEFYKPYSAGNHSPGRSFDHADHRKCRHAIHIGNNRHHQAARTMV